MAPASSLAQPLLPPPSLTHTATSHTSFAQSTDLLTPTSCHPTQNTSASNDHNTNGNGNGENSIPTYLFGILATLLSIATVYIAYLQLRKTRGRRGGEYRHEYGYEDGYGGSEGSRSYEYGYEMTRGL